MKTAEENLELHKIITFDEMVKHGRDNGANIVNGMPWSWKINGYAVTHENDYCYLIETPIGIEKIYQGEYLVARENGLQRLTNYPYDTHAPGGCPL